MKYISVYVNGVFYEEADDYTFDNRTGVFVFANKFNADEKVTIIVSYIDNASGSIDTTYENVYERVKYYDNFPLLSQSTTPSVEPTTPSVEPTTPSTPQRLYLYRNGDECTSVTGGLDITYNENCTLTKETNCLRWTPSSGTKQYSCLHSHNKITLDGTYSAVHIDFEDYITVSNVSYFSSGFNSTNDTRPYNDSNVIWSGSTASSSNRSRFKNQRFTDLNLYEADVAYNNGSPVDLINTFGEYYFYLVHYSDYSQTGYANIYSIWLE